MTEEQLKGLKEKYPKIDVIALEEAYEQGCAHRFLGNFFGYPEEDIAALEAGNLEWDEIKNKPEYITFYKRFPELYSVGYIPSILTIKKALQENSIDWILNKDTRKKNGLNIDFE